MSEVVEKTKKPKRRRSGTAKWHMSREAVDLPLDAVYKMDEKTCWEFFVETRFGSKDTVRCPYCGSIGRHKFRLHDKRRWKCHGCRSTFSVTTGHPAAAERDAVADCTQHRLFSRHRISGVASLMASIALSSLPTRCRNQLRRADQKKGGTRSPAETGGLLGETNFE